MRAISDAVVAVFLFARNIDLSPTRTGRQDDGSAFQYGAADGFNFDQPAWHQAFGALQIHDVDAVGLYVLFERDCEMRSIGFLDRDEVFDRERV